LSEVQRKLSKKSSFFIMQCPPGIFLQLKPVKSMQLKENGYTSNRSQSVSLLLAMMSSMKRISFCFS